MMNEAMIVDEEKLAKTILIVDDHTLFREGLKVLLKKSPRFTVAGEAGSVQEAVARSKELKPDIVLIDIALPGENGIQGIQRILECNWQPSVIVISMYSKCDFIIAALKAGATGYLIKDSTPDMLIEALDKVAAGNYFFDPSTLSEIVQFVLDQNIQRTSVSETNYDRLTRREQEIMRLVAKGLSTKEIAGKLFISPKTVENHRAKIMEKLAVDNIVDLVKYAAKLGIIDIRNWESDHQ